MIRNIDFEGSEIMRSFIDSHCDTITTIMRNNQELFENESHVDLLRLKKYDNPVQFFAIWLEPFYYPQALKQTLVAIEFFHKEMSKYKDIISHVTTYADILENKKNNKISAFLSIEGGESLEGSTDILDVFYRLGVRAMTLTWNHKNLIGVGAEENDRNEGISSFGKEVIKKMNNIGMIVDVSHICDRGFWDVIEETKMPIIASHSNCRSICNVNRNLTDEQIKAIAKIEGVIGINFYPFFVNGTDKCTVEEIMKHIDHIINLVGDDYIGIGSDFDGISCVPTGLEDISKIDILLDAIENKYGKSTAKKIAEQNYLRVIKQVLKS